MVSVRPWPPKRPAARFCKQLGAVNYFNIFGQGMAFHTPFIIDGWHVLGSGLHGVRRMEEGNIGYECFFYIRTKTVHDIHDTRRRYTGLPTLSTPCWRSVPIYIPPMSSAEGHRDTTQYPPQVAHPPLPNEFHSPSTNSPSSHPVSSPLTLAIGNYTTPNMLAFNSRARRTEPPLSIVCLPLSF